MRRSRIFAAFFVAALLFRLGIAAGAGKFHWLERSEVEVIALNVLQFGDYNLYGGPTAHATPVFPLVLAGIFSLFGTGVLAQSVCVTLACLASALRCGLLPLFAMDAGLGRGVGMVAGCVGTLYIGSVDTEISGKFDGPFVALALLGLIWAAMRLWHNGSWQTRTPWPFAAFCGFCALLNPGLLPVMAGLLLAGAIACPAKARPRYLRQTAVVAAGVLIFLAPWAVRNYQVLGSPILTRSNFGLEFWVSNGPGRAFDLADNSGDALHPSGNLVETSQVSDLGEVAYNRMKLAEAAGWVGEHPGAFLRLTAQRTAGWWFPPHPRVLLAPKLVLTLLAFGGLWLMFRRQPLVAWLMLVTWLTFPDVYYLIQWIGRYRFPMDWQILLCASVTLYTAWEIFLAPQFRTLFRARFRRGYNSSEIPTGSGE